MYVEKKKTDEEMNEMKNKFLERKMIDTIIDNDATVYTKEGKLLFLFRKKKLTGGQEFYENIADFMKKHPTTNRGSASGATKFNVKDNPKVYSTITGYFDRWSPKQKFLFKKLGIKTPIEVRETMFLSDHPDKFKKMIPFVQKIDALYKKLVPDQYKKQYAKAKETYFKIGNTSFTTMTTNINFQTTIHKDTGDDEEGFGNLAVIERGKYTGGETCFPQYGIGVNVREGDILFMDVHEWHANLPIIKENANVERLSVVCYLRRKVWERTRNKTRKFLTAHNKTVRKIKIEAK
jgi:hypothetical protein